MKRIWKAKVTKFGSLISLLAIAAMLVIFALALPEFFATTNGRIFAGVWAVLAIASCWAHATRLSEQRRNNYISRLFAGSTKEKPRKSQRQERLMRG